MVFTCFFELLFLRFLSLHTPTKKKGQEQEIEPKETLKDTEVVEYKGFEG